MNIYHADEITYHKKKVALEIGLKGIKKGEGSESL